MFVGKFVLNSLIRTAVMEIERDGMVEKGIFIPFKDNDIVQWKDEIQLWFRAVAYRERKSWFSHFLMKSIPTSQIKRMSASQIEAFANRSLGGMSKVDSKSEIEIQNINQEDFISQNI